MDYIHLKAIYDAIIGYLNSNFLWHKEDYNSSKLFPTDTAINNITSISTERENIKNIRNTLINSGVSNATIVNELLNKYHISTTGIGGRTLSIE